ncbi:MAG TPA: hypothetical protein VNT58_10630 [Gaiellaceae bacterium]|nr:hypothetical protein [Gaiellaceae bacterium]
MREPTLIRLTLDASVVHDLAKDARPCHAAAVGVVGLHGSRLADVAVTRYIDDDIPDDPLATLVRELPVLRAGGVFTIGFSLIGGDDGLGWQRFLDLQEELQLTWRPSSGKPPDARDWSHLHAHAIKRRHLFVTRDVPLLELVEVLAPLLAADAEAEQLLPLRAVTPQTLLDRLKNPTACPVCSGTQVTVTLRDPAADASPPPRISYGRWSECRGCLVQWTHPEPDLPDWLPPPSTSGSR